MADRGMARERKSLGHLRLVGDDGVPPAPAAPTKAVQVLHHISRRAVPWYLHRGTTKTGKPKYFVAKSVGSGALSEMPAGFEFAESVNGVVSVRRVDPSSRLVTDIDVATVGAEVARHRQLRHHRVEAGRHEIVIYEPVGAMSDADLRESARALYVPAERYEQIMTNRWVTGRFHPVLRFRPVVDKPGEYFAERMTYRGEGGWSYPLQFGPLAKLVKQYVPSLGTQGSFERY